MCSGESSTIACVASRRRPSRWNSSIQYAALAMKNSRTGPESGPSKLNGFAPLRGVACAEELRGELAHVVPVRAEVVVDHIENDADPDGVSRVDEAAKVIGGAVKPRRCVQADAVVSPAECAGEIGDRHECDRRDAERRQVRESRGGGGPSSFRCEGPDVHLVEYLAVGPSARARRCQSSRKRMNPRLATAHAGRRAGSATRDQGTVPDRRRAESGSVSHRGCPRRTRRSTRPAPQRVQVRDRPPHDLDTRPDRRPDAEVAPFAIRLHTDRITTYEIDADHGRPQVQIGCPPHGFFSSKAFHSKVRGCPFQRKFCEPVASRRDSRHTPQNPL